ncbi:MAG: cytochrome-c peroxidase [Cyanobacteria bacterium REEB67]|nr:cytochrome-c peroxidase [Cyanobacteria bacterium REEB67]
MQVSCVDCHTQGMTSYPIYFQWPIAKEMIAHDIESAQTAFRLSKNQLAGLEPIGAIDLAKIATVIKSGSMPPAKYTLLHWSAALSDSQKGAILSYIQDKQEDSGIALTAIPEKNPFHVDVDKARLGERLYFDKRLSTDNSVSCASCHALDKGGTDRLRVSTGVHGEQGAINSPTVFNSAFNFCQFWDGRARDLADQVSGPITNPHEMATDFKSILTKLAGDTAYGAMSKAAYKASLSESNIKDAIANYEKTLLTPNSAFDKYLKGDQSALSDQQKRGYLTFMEKGCATCHAGVGMGGMSFEKMGVYKDYFAYRENTLHMPHTPADDGRFNVSHDRLDMGKFKVPLLRNIALTAPYFHDGSAATLREAVSVMGVYEAGNKLTAAETDSIVAFLESLTGEYKGKKLQ